MDNFLNCHYSDDSWERNIIHSISLSNNVEAVPTAKQRCQANARERDRTQNSVNMAFNALRLLIPTEPPDRKLSKIEILRLAGSYITHLDNQLYTGEMEQPCLQMNDLSCKSRSLCTFCWSTVKKEKLSTPPHSSYEKPY
ncbi:unnamed protein product [Parnassius mnemosyne]|uniref:BHLH domain-containing protein n=1 Tax=Parnassius mnemosyne TaxID=213953 RepID=A0AAV1KB48_9NEOP